MTILDRNQILGARRKSQVVEVPDLDGSVRIAQLTIADVMELAKADDDHNYGVRLLQRAIVDEALQPLFSPDDLEALTALSSAVVSQLVVHAKQLSGIGNAAIEGAEKNSAPRPSGDSSSS